MEIIRDHLHHWDSLQTRVPLLIDRLTLARRRWRALAEDGTEFGFDLEHPLADGDVFFQGASAYYQIEQKPELVLEIPLVAPDAAARMGWMIGNLHFQIAVEEGVIRAPDDPAIRQLLTREHIHHRQAEAVFRPLGGGHSHGHGHAH
jgi:urease accessory protein